MRVLLEANSSSVLLSFERKKGKSLFWHSISSWTYPLYLCISSKDSYSSSEAPKPIDNRVIGKVTLCFTPLSPLLSPLISPSCRKKETQDETQFTIKVGGKTSLGPSYFLFVKFSFPVNMFDALLCWNWPFLPLNRLAWLYG
jgi:hypothetical protein